DDLTAKTTRRPRQTPRHSTDRLDRPTRPNMRLAAGHGRLALRPHCAPASAEATQSWAYFPRSTPSSLSHRGPQNQLRELNGIGFRETRQLRKRGVTVATLIVPQAAALHAAYRSYVSADRRPA